MEMRMHNYAIFLVATRVILGDTGIHHRLAIFPNLSGGQVYISVPSKLHVYVVSVSLTCTCSYG